MVYVSTCIWRVQKDDVDKNVGKNISNQQYNILK